MSSPKWRSGPTKNWICTEAAGDGITCKWTLTISPLFLRKNSRVIRSPSFYTADRQEEWALELYPRGVDETSTDKVSCFLRLESSARLGIHATFKITILKANNMIAEEKFTHTFDHLGAWGESKFVDNSKIFGPDWSELTIIIHCTTDTMIEDTIKEQTTTYSLLQDLGNDFRLLFEDPKFSDITIIVGNDKFPAHKCILSARSSVFAAMFSHEGMDENRKKEVKIEDTEPAVVRAMLEYIYTGQVVDFEVLVDGLLVAAEKYNMTVLKAACEETLGKNLDIDNAAGILTLANLHGASKLEESAIKFLNDHLQDVIQTHGYNEITDHALLKKIISFISQAK